MDATSTLALVTVVVLAPLYLLMIGLVVFVLTAMYQLTK